MKLNANFHYVLALHRSMTSERHYIHGWKWLRRKGSTWKSCSMNIIFLPQPWNLPFFWARTHWIKLMIMTMETTILRFVANIFFLRLGGQITFRFSITTVWDKKFYKNFRWSKIFFVFISDFDSWFWFTLSTVPQIRNNRWTWWLPVCDIRQWTKVELWRRSAQRYVNLIYNLNPTYWYFFKFSAIFTIVVDEPSVDGGMIENANKNIQVLALLKKEFKVRICFTLASSANVSYLCYIHRSTTIT